MSNSTDNSSTQEQCQQISIGSPIGVLMIISYCLGIISIIYLATIKIYKRINPPSTKIVQQSSEIVQRSLSSIPTAVEVEEPESSVAAENIEDVIQTMSSALQAITTMVKTIKN